jgi:hypothetical protein
MKQLFSLLLLATPFFSKAQQSDSLQFMVVQIAPVQGNIGVDEKKMFQLELMKLKFGSHWIGDTIQVRYGYYAGNPKQGEWKYVFHVPGTAFKTHNEQHGIFIDEYYPATVVAIRNYIVR